MTDSNRMKVILRCAEFTGLALFEMGYSFEEVAAFLNQNDHYIAANSVSNVLSIRRTCEAVLAELDKREPSRK